jgi:hypothetical protein
MMDLFLDELDDLSLGFFIIKIGSKPYILTASSRTSILFAITSPRQRPLSPLNFFKLATMAEYVGAPQAAALASDATSVTLGEHNEYADWPIKSLHD